MVQEEGHTSQFTDKVQKRLLSSSPVYMARVLGDMRRSPRVVQESPTHVELVMSALDLKLYSVNRDSRSPHGLSRKHCQTPTPNGGLPGLERNPQKHTSAAGLVTIKPYCSPLPARPGVHISSDHYSLTLLTPHPPC